MDESERNDAEGWFRLKKPFLLKIEEMFNEVGLAEFSQIFVIKKNLTAFNKILW
jgi:hypothetical protein